ncbi:protein kinase [Streptomyces sp. NPDC008150]|uniref:serine/threonine-protein kinase n=1 Tax=Streptomyces sp. NPDC008150 TaxID=3364816 RepID=UPI0036EB25F5
MSSDGGARYGSDEPTSFGLQPPRPRSGPLPDNPYAVPAAAVPQQGPPAPPSPDTPPSPDAVRSPGAPGSPNGTPAPAPHPAAPPDSSTPDSSPSPPGAPDSAATAPSARPEEGAGRLIAGRYRLLAKLGHGGMGTVWRAKDETMDREVAVKEPRVPDHLPERERANAFERMRREARAAARLDHPSVVNVHDVAVVDGRPWIVMELVHGRSLGDVLQEGTLGGADAARIGLEVLGALEAAHAGGVLHRDVKPDNILLGRYGRVVLTDFGIAQIEGETNLTDTGGFVGSPEYIAPERVLGQRPGPASDLWSLGVSLYAATEGVSPFRRSNTPATLQSVLNATPAAPASAAGPLAEVITALLQKDPARRPDAARVRALLDAAAHPPAPAPTALAPLPAPAETGGRRGTAVRLGRGAWLAAGSVVVAAAVAAYLLLADPFAGPLPDGWKKQHSKDVAATLAFPAGYTRTLPDRKSDKGHWVEYADPSGSVWMTLVRLKASEDENHQIQSSAPAEMYKDNAGFQASGSYDLSMPEKPAKTRTRPVTYKSRGAAENTITYTTTDSDHPRPREVVIFYYRTTGSDMYKLTVSYPGKGDFVARGREVAREAVDNLDIDKL